MKSPPIKGVTSTS